MNLAPKAPVDPVLAATLLLLRDGRDGLEVLMTTRHDAAGFAAGAMVFPGGKVDAGDRELARRHAGAAAGGETGTALRIAAIRESFEEARILFARPLGGSELLAHSAVTALLELESGKIDFHAFVPRAAVELATDLLVPFAHWITPVDRPKRFDTHFFLAPAPRDQVAFHDGREIVEVRWTTPPAALADADAGRLKLVNATRMNLIKLGRSATVAEALTAARRAPVVTVQPELVQTPNGPAFRIPAAAGYGITEMSLDKIQRA